MLTTRNAANSKLSSPKGPTSNEDIMAAIKALKVKISTTSKALSDSLRLFDLEI